LTGRTWSLTDALSDARFDRSGDELARDGFSVALDPWGSRVLTLES
jgi:hypothetical protein